MMDGTRTVIAIPLVAVALFAAPRPAGAQAQPAGVVTTLQGEATLTRVAMPQPQPLKLRDDLFVQDRVQTADRSLARILLGGKAVVTVREHSQLTITEVPGTSTIELATGRIAVAAVKERMKRGETIQIRTPNAVAAIRGTIVIAEVSPAAPRRDAAAPDVTTTVTVIRGLVDFTPIDAARRVTGPMFNLGPLDVASVTRTAAASKRTTSAAAAGSLASTFRAPLSDTGIPAGMSGLVSTQQTRAASYVGSLLGPSTAVSTPPAPAVEAAARTKTSARSAPASAAVGTTSAGQVVIGAAVAGSDDRVADDGERGGRQRGRKRTNEGLPVIDVGGNQHGGDSQPERGSSPARDDVARNKDLQLPFVTAPLNSGPSALGGIDGGSLSFGGGSNGLGSGPISATPGGSRTGGGTTGGGGGIIVGGGTTTGGVIVPTGGTIVQTGGTQGNVPTIGNSGDPGGGGNGNGAASNSHRRVCRGKC